GVSGRKRRSASLFVSRSGSRRETFFSSYLSACPDRLCRRDSISWSNRPGDRYPPTMQLYGEEKRGGNHGRAQALRDHPRTATRTRLFACERQRLARRQLWQITLSFGQPRPQRISCGRSYSAISRNSSPGHRLSSRKNSQGNGRKNSLCHFSG